MLHLGGNWNNGSNVSPVYSNGNNTPSNANINFGGCVILSLKFEILLILLLENLLAKKWLVVETLRTPLNRKDKI